MMGEMKVAMKALILLTFFANANCMRTFPLPYAPQTFYKNFSTYSNTFHTYTYQYGSDGQNGQPSHPSSYPISGRYYPSPYYAPIDFDPQTHPQEYRQAPQGHHEGVRRELPVHFDENRQDLPPYRDSRQRDTFEQIRDDEDDGAFPVQSKQGSSSADREEKKTDTIFYPGFDFNPNRPTRDLIGANCTLGFCEDATDYPSDQIKKTLNISKNLNAFFNVSHLPSIDTKAVGSPENLCKADMKLIFPKVAVNTKQKKRYIANVDEYKQAIWVETCDEQSKSCQFSNFWPSNYVSICEQRYTITPLVALDDEMNTIVDTFQSPSCCVCLFKEK